MSSNVTYHSDECTEGERKLTMGHITMSCFLNMDSSTFYTNETRDEAMLRLSPKERVKSTPSK